MIEITKKDIGSRIVDASKELDKSGTFEYLRKEVGPYTGRLTGQQLELVSALEMAIATYSAVFEHTENHMDTSTYPQDTEKFRERRVFANRYALFVGSEVGLRYLYAGEKQPKKDDVSSKKIQLIQEPGEVIKDISTHFANFVTAATKNRKDNDYMVDVADTFLHSMKNTALNGYQSYTKLFSKYPELEQMDVLSTVFKRFTSHEPGKSEDKKLTFDDYAGQEIVKSELQDIAEFVKDPTALRMWGGQVPSGFLLVGPAGVGKTYLAEVFADQCGLPFHEVKLSDILTKYYGEGSQLVNKHFTKHGIVFIDEFDTLGRTIGDKDTNEGTEQIVNTIKQVMSGFGKSVAGADDTITFYLAASNNLEIVDPTLIRPGRFKPIVMEPYDQKGLADIYEVQERLRIKSSSGQITTFDPEINKENVGIAASKRDLTPADIKYILQDITNKRAREQKKVGVDKPLDPINEKEIIESIETYEKSSESVLKSVISKF